MVDSITELKAEIKELRDLFGCWTTNDVPSIENMKQEILLITMIGLRAQELAEVDECE